MSIIFTILTLFVVAASILLTIVVLLQNSKGGGLASNFVAGNQTFGVRQTTDILEKVSWGLVTFILVVSIITSFTMGNKSSNVDVTDKIENTATEQPAFPEAPAQKTATPDQAAPASQTPAKPAK